jgi:hypothetical protein
MHRFTRKPTEPNGATPGCSRAWQKRAHEASRGKGKSGSFALGLGIRERSGAHRLCRRGCREPTAGVGGVIREVLWSAWDGPGLGHLRLTVRDSGVVADGLVLGLEEGRPFRLAYEVRCDRLWRVRSARVGVPGEPPKVELLSDGEGNWATSDGRAMRYLKGCEYVDISATPFTNTLPIRRLGLAPGEAADVSVAYFDGTELQCWPEPQRYTCLEDGDEGGLYRYLSLDGGFTADLPVDADGLVLDYPGLFRRALP